MPVIESAPGGELTTITKTYAIPLSNGSNQDYWAKLLNLYTALGIPRVGQMLNGKISPAVSSNDLILSLKTASGGTPSADDPIYININGTVRKVTAATSITLADGTNWMNLGSTELATIEQDIFAYAVWDSSDSVVAIAPSRFPDGRVVSNFHATTTNEKHLGGYANFSGTDDVCLIGRFAATLSATAAFTWSVPAYTSENLIQEPIYNTRLLAFNPVWTNLVVGTTGASSIYRYMIDRNTYEEFIDIVLGTGFSVGNCSHTVAFGRHADYAGGAAGTIPGTLRFHDTGTNTFVANPIFNTSDTSILYRVMNSAGTHVIQDTLSSTVPFTWAATDELHEWVRYFI